MPAPILPVNLPVAPVLDPKPASVSGGAGGEFQAAFADAISKVNAFQQNAHQSVDRFLNGEGDEVHRVALAAQQADLSFQMFLAVRNKVVSAYQEVMRMQV